MNKVYNDERVCNELEEFFNKETGQTRYITKWDWEQILERNKIE